MENNIKTVCDICGNKCMIIVTMKDGHAISVKGDEDDQLTKGRICIKGQTSLETLYSDKRIKRPLLRIGAKGENKWREISWDKAIELTCQKFMHYKENYGAKSIFTAYGYSKDFINTLLVRLSRDLDVPNIVSPDYICYMPLKLAHDYTLGFYPKADINNNTKCLILWGVNKFKTRFSDLYPIIEAKKHGMKTIVIDPYKTQHARGADLWLAIKPGTDIFLAYGMLKIIIEDKLYDEDFVRESTVGFDKLKELLSRYSLDEIEKITTIDINDIKKAAYMYMENSPSAIIDGNALDMNEDSFQKCRAIAILISLSKSIDVSGGMVDYEGKSLTKDLWPYSDDILDMFTEDFLKDRVGNESIKFPEFYNTTPQAVTRAIVDEVPYSIKCGFIQGSNVVMSWPDTNKTIDALKKLDFLVVSDLFMTPTSLLADLVLPASSFFEYDSIKQSKDGSLLIQNMIDKPYDSLPDYEILNRIGSYLELSEEYNIRNEEYINKCISPSGLSFEDVKSYNGLSNKAFENHIYEKHKINGFKTETGKIEFYSRKLESYGINPLPIASIDILEEDIDYPLILTTKKTKKFIHSTGKIINGLVKDQRYPFAEMAYETGDIYKLKNNDSIYIKTSLGKIKHKVRLSNKLASGIVMAESGWWMSSEDEKTLFGSREYNYNVLVSGKQNINDDLGSIRIRGLNCQIEKVIE